MVLLALSVPHQLSVTVSVLPRFSRLLPVVPAVFPARRLKLMVTGPAPTAPVAIPPPVPVDVLPVIVTLVSVAERDADVGFTKIPPPCTTWVLLAPCPFLLPEITVP